MTDRALGGFASLRFTDRKTLSLPGLLIAAWVVKVSKASGNPERQPFLSLGGGWCPKMSQDGENRTKGSHCREKVVAGIAMRSQEASKEEH